MTNVVIGSFFLGAIVMGYIVAYVIFATTGIAYLYQKRGYCN
jgi:fructose-specific phosphotransferase system IIC component